MVKPSECNARRELPLTMLVSQMIDLATDHANQLGIGFLSLEPHGLGWILSRLSVEMTRWPANGQKYFLSTWIESYNAHFSERCFSVSDADGNPLGYARTIWMIIDLVTHKGMGTAATVVPEEMIPDQPCPIRRMVRVRPLEPVQTAAYTFQYCDLDFYRHVNTIRYISVLLNRFSLEEFDTHFLSRFDIAFSHEAKYGETALIGFKSEEGATEETTPLITRIFEMSVGDRQILTSSVILKRD